MSKATLASSVASRIASKLTPVIETAVDPVNRFKARAEHYSFHQLVKFISFPFAILFGANAVPYIRGTDDSNFIFGWRLLAHVGPYHVPRLVEKEEWLKSLKSLSQANDLKLVESEIAQLLTNIEVLTQRRMAVKKMVKRYGFEVFIPIFENLASPPPLNTHRKSHSHFEANLRVAMDVVCATPARERKLDCGIIENFLTNNSDLWESTEESSKRFREYRALILLKLLQNDENVKAAKKSPVIKSFVLSEIGPSKHEPFPAFPIVPLLYQFKTEKLGFEHFDIIRRIRTMLELPVSEEEKQIVRKSLALEHKLDLVNFEQLVYLTICYASLRVVPLISEYSVKVLSRAANVIARSVLGATVLETTYRAEEHLIQTAPWYESSGLTASAAVASANILVGALVLRYFPYCGVPWCMIRAKDSFSDTFRFI